ncbi:MAG: hypothetical protein ACK47M_21755 [Caldilinea sp.]
MKSQPYNVSLPGKVWPTQANAFVSKLRCVRVWLINEREMKLLRNVAGGDVLNVQQKDSNDGRVLVITLTHAAQPLKEQREHSRSDQAAVERGGY